MTDEQPGRPPRFDTSVASIARTYDYLLGGKDHFPADREAGDELIRNYPDIVSGVRMNRAFLGRAIHYLAAEAGIRQFLDIGTGLPSANNTHEVAQRAAPESRIVYVDNDPVVLAHAEALLTTTPEGACDYIEADARDTGTILKAAARTLDFGRPVAVCLIMLLHFIPDEEDPWQLTRTLMEAVPSGSYLAVTQPASDVDSSVGPALRQLNTRIGGSGATPRTREDVARFFDGLTMVDPGVVTLHRWRPGTGLSETSRDWAAWCGVARKP